MDLTLILGPMKSGKSYELISYFSHLRYTDIPFCLYQSARNVRDAQIWSRSGVNLEAKKISSLREVLETDYKIVGIDELHMFSEDEVQNIEKILKRGTRVIAAGLDTDYQGRLFTVIKGLLELCPKEVKYRRAVCENCKIPDAIYTQVFRGMEPIVSGMPPCIPDDGIFSYKAVCCNCFVKARDLATAPFVFK